MNNVANKLGVFLFTVSLLFSGAVFAEKSLKKVVVIQDLVLSDGFAVLNDGQEYGLDSDLMSSLYAKQRTGGGWGWSVGQPVLVEVEYVAPGKSDYTRIITSIRSPMKEEQKQ